MGHLVSVKGVRAAFGDFGPALMAKRETSRREAAGGRRAAYRFAETRILVLVVSRSRRPLGALGGRTRRKRNLRIRLTAQSPQPNTSRINCIPSMSPGFQSESLNSSYFIPGRKSLRN